MAYEDVDETDLRDDQWLSARVRLLWEMHFADVPRGYPIVARFGSRARYRFGSIAARNGQTIILINRLFAQPDVPVYVVDGTLAHEMAHYAHGFGSGLPKLHKDAHRGGVVDLELERRGLGQVNERAEQWRKANWNAFYDAQCADLLTRRTARRDIDRQKWDVYLGRAGARTEADLAAHLTRTAARLTPICPFRQPLLTVTWLTATCRQTAPSYWYSRERILRLHGLLSDPQVPEEVIDFELAYWMIRMTVGEQWQSIHTVFCRAGMAALAEEALTWRRRRWTRFRQRNHPLELSGESAGRP